MRTTFSFGFSRAFLALVALGTLPACYTFQTIDPATAAMGDEVQLTLSGPATRGLAPTALVGETKVHGDLTGLTEDSISVSVWIGQAYRGTPFEPVHQSYTFPRVELVRVEKRQLSRSRTALTAAGVLAGIYLLIDRLEFLEDPNPGGQGDDNEPPIDEILFSWGWRIGNAP